MRFFSVIASLFILFSLLTPSLSIISAKGVTNSLSSVELDSKEKIALELQEEFNESDEVSFIIKFRDKADTEQAREKVISLNSTRNLSANEIKLQQRSAVISELKATAIQSQQNVLTYLKKQERLGKAKDIEPFFIVNGIGVTATEEIAKKIATFPEVEEILPNEMITLDVLEDEQIEAKPATNGEIEWNVDRVNAPEVWEMGIDGTGTVVAIMDTGVDWHHPALKHKYRGYNPETGEVDHTYSWYDRAEYSSEPTDGHSHGTHVAGTIVGSEENGTNKIGVAPGAKWIGVKVFRADGTGTGIDYISAAEWLLAPGGRADLAPDVVNNSWSSGFGFNEWFREIVQRWVHANIFPVYSAGNINERNPGGPYSISNPANYPESFAVGATDEYNLLAYFSLRGPSPYGEIKPDISAPGVFIRSSLPGGDYGYKSGTSMAAPAVAGVVALLKQIDKSIEVEDLANVLKQTAIPLTNTEYPDSPNNGYGHGLVDAHAALNIISTEAGIVSGKVVSEITNLPLQANVSVLESDVTISTDSNSGLYSFIHRAGDYTLRAEAYGYQGLEKRVSIDPKEEIEVNFALQVKDKYTLSGTVINEDTKKPIEGATILLIEDSNIEPVSANANGQFELTAYEGEYTVKVFAPGYYDHELLVTFDENRTIQIELSPFYSHDQGKIYYDDGTAEIPIAFSDGGHKLAVKMSLPENERSALVKEGIFKFWGEDYPYQGGTRFLVEVWDANGPHGFPGNKLAGPIEAEAIRDLNRWTVVDLTAENIVVNDDFYIVYVQPENRSFSPALAVDRWGEYSDRNYQSIGGNWIKMDEESGNYMIRATVDYLFSQPVFTSLPDNLSTNEEQVTIEGIALPEIEVKIYNNLNKVSTVQADTNGMFRATVPLTDGDNIVKAIATINGKEFISEEVTIIYDATPPTLLINKPVDGAIIDDGTVLVEGTAYDDNLDYVLVNGNYANLSGNTFSKSVSLFLGENVITIEAVDLAGNSTVKNVIVESTYDSNPIKNVQPSEDLYVTAGELFEISFESEVYHGDAWFHLHIPRGNVYEILSYPMYQYEPGVYRAYHVFPEDFSAEGIEIEIELYDYETGLINYRLASGKLYVYEEAVERIYGTSRFDTAVAISQAGWQEADTVILARSDDYADALAGVPLAYQLDAPILLTRPKSLPIETLQEIFRLGAQKVIVLGGTLAISEEIIEIINEAGIDVERISGSSRTATAVEIAKRLSPGGIDQAIVVNGFDFPDALSVGSQAALTGTPILLTHPTRLSEPTKEALSELGVKETIVVGGRMAVNDAVMSQLPNPERVSGSDRVATNIAIQEHFNVDAKHMYVATGNNFADSLTGAVLAAKNNSSILLVRNSLIDVTKDFIIDRGVKRISILGGSVAVNEKIEKDLEKLLK